MGGSAAFEHQPLGDPTGMGERMTERQGTRVSLVTLGPLTLVGGIIGYVKFIQGVTSLPGGMIRPKGLGQTTGQWIPRK